MPYALIGAGFERQISQAEFLAIQTAKQDVIFATVGEETLIIVTQNFNEFELELLQGAQMRIESGLGDYAESMDLRLAIDRRLLNVLTASRLYLDQTNYLLCELFGSDSEEQKQLVGFRSNVYDERFGYRIMEALRNYAQHRGLAVARIGCRQTNVQTPEAPLWEISIVPELSSAELAGDPKFKKSVAQEMLDHGEFLDLRPIVREYVAGLSEIHAMFRGILAKRFTLAVNRLREIIREAPNPMFLSAAERRDSGDVIQRVALPGDLLTRAEQLRTRSSGLALAAVSYVSSASTR
jgi:hypothetical protein